MTLRSFVVDEWLPAIASRLEPTTLDSYRRTIEHVLDRIGDVPLQAIDPAMLNHTYSDLLASGRRDGRGGLSPRTVRYAHTVTSKALSDAVRWGRLARNVAAFADPPSPRQARAPEMAIWSPEELGRFLEALAEDPLCPLFRLAAMTGMRRGEVCGLSWVDVNLETGLVTVQRQLRATRRIAADGRRRPELTDMPKTAAGRRTIDIDPKTVQALRDHRRRQGEQKMLMGPAWIAAPDGGPVHPERVAEAFERRVVRSRMPRIRFHDLRHTHAAHLIAAGVHVEVLCKRLGHASPAFTLAKYGHLVPGLQAGAAAATAALVDGP